MALIDAINKLTGVNQEQLLEAQYMRVELKSLTDRVSGLLALNKQDRLERLESMREASKSFRAPSLTAGNGGVKSSSGKTKDQKSDTAFGIADALTFAGLAAITMFNDEISAVIEQAQDNLMKFVNDVQKIMFTLNQGLIGLKNFINTNIISKINMLILDFRTNPKLTAISTVIEETLTKLRSAIDDVVKVIKQTFTVIGNSVKFIGSIFRPIIALLSGGVSEALIASVKLGGALKFFKGIGKVFSKLFLPLTIFITAWDTIKGAVEGFKEDGIIGGIEGAVTGFFNSLIFAPLDLLKKATEWVLDQVGLTGVSDLLSEFSFVETFDNLVSKTFDLIGDITSWISDRLGVGLVSQMLRDFSFSDLYDKLLTSIFDGLQNVVDLVVDIFSFSEDGLDIGLQNFGDLINTVMRGVNSAIAFVQDLFTFPEDGGALAVFGKMTDILYAPINLAVNFVKGIFDFGDPEVPFKMSDFLGSLVTNIFGKIGDAFSEFALKLELGAKVAGQQLITEIMNIPDRILKYLSENLRIDIPRIAIPIPKGARFIFGGAEEIVLFDGANLGIPGGEGAARRIASRNESRDAAIAEFGRQYVEKQNNMTGLAVQQLNAAAGAAGGGTTIIYQTTNNVSGGGSGAAGGVGVSSSTAAASNDYLGTLDATQVISGSPSR